MRAAIRPHCFPPQTVLLVHAVCRYILWEAEDKGLELPYACRMGCCTACAVKVLQGEVSTVLGEARLRWAWGESVARACSTRRQGAMSVLVKWGRRCV